MIVEKGKVFFSFAYVVWFEGRPPYSIVCTFFCFGLKGHSTASSVLSLVLFLWF